MTRTLIDTVMPLTSIGKSFILPMEVLVALSAVIILALTLGLVVVFEVAGVDKLLVAAIDILLATVVDKLEVDILVFNKLAVASLVGNSDNIALSLVGYSEFETSNQSFNIDFLIIDYLSDNGSQFVDVLVYHNSGKNAFSVATIDWLMMLNIIDYRNN
ncbi:hypothetical protein G9A89_018155 [Geosiphon pyriformis]|nr:hypothetical protein G9A89_018155 [Geosiphon pyriformis]